MKITRYFLVILLVCYYQSFAIADEQPHLIPPTLTYEQAVKNIENIIVSKGGNLEDYKLTNIMYEYTKGEWFFSYDIKQGPHFFVYMNDKNPSIYRFVGGA